MANGGVPSSVISAEGRPFDRQRRPGTDRTDSELPANCAENSCQSCQSPAGFAGIWAAAAARGERRRPAMSLSVLVSHSGMHRALDMDRLPIDRKSVV